MSAIDKQLDSILDRFSKAHPFADTRAYNIFHENAIAQLKTLINEQVATAEQQLLTELLGELPDKSYLADEALDVPLDEQEVWDKSWDAYHTAVVSVIEAKMGGPTKEIFFKKDLPTVLENIDKAQNKTNDGGRDG